MEKITLGIFDDHPIVSDGLQAFFKDYHEFVDILFTANTKEALLVDLKQNPTQILILDVVAPGINGLELFEKVLKEYPETKIIAYTTLKSTILVENLLTLGVKGFVSKNQTTSDLFQAILDVHKDDISVPTKYKFLTSKFRVKPTRNLTKREVEIIELIAKEATTQAIAQQLSLSTKTIENHKRNIFKKLAVKNSAGLVLAAIRLGYIS